MTRYLAFILLSLLVLVGSGARSARAVETGSSAPLSAEKMSKEQFIALPPTAVIDFKGAQMTKAEFQARRAQAFGLAAKEAQNRKAEARARFEAARASFRKDEADRLKAANQKAQAEIDRLVAADNASHGANWSERKRQAAELLSEAATAPPERRSQLEKSAGELLAPANSP
ncbi:hypothetical protein [Methylocystis bryophila]|uniref:DUF4398 domain-containing protein n=1 Tax=Methylocystis bryophila TaxID=655015 RepID=A0A1W6MYR5_9HYPH|nr:hypothetical protein [Methylocystis bryophila]ARN82731.1 hypothetical protein B1812_18365 [Methylocystis bryophila]BDV38962.1 hypothetical protein DSM21852_22150 [Methylocystis bryophila]